MIINMKIMSLKNSDCHQISKMWRHCSKTLDKIADFFFLQRIVLDNNKKPNWT